MKNSESYSSLKTKINNLNDKIKDLESTIDQHQDTVGWERLKKTASPKFWTPHGKRVTLMTNIAHCLSQTQRVTLTQRVFLITEPPIISIPKERVTHRNSLKDQLHTVHLQRKINYLEQKLKEKSEQSKIYEDPSEAKPKV